MKRILCVAAVCAALSASPLAAQVASVAETPQPAQAGTPINASSYSATFGGGTALTGMTVTAFGTGNVQLGSAAFGPVGGSTGLWDAQSPPAAGFGFSAWTEYCAAATACQSSNSGGVFFPVQPGAFVSSMYSAGITRLLFDIGTSSTVFTGTFNWLAQYAGDPAFDNGNVTFRNQVVGQQAWGQMDIDFTAGFAGQLPGEVQYTAGMGTIVRSTGGGGGGGGPTVGVPEPGSLMLLLTGLLGLGLVAYRRRPAGLL